MDLVEFYGSCPARFPRPLGLFSDVVVLPEFLPDVTVIFSAGLRS